MSDERSLKSLPAETRWLWPRWPIRHIGITLAIAVPCLALAGGFQEEAVAVPTIASVQAAYDDAKLEEIDHHDDQLLIHQADCRQIDQDKSTTGKFTCQVGFTDQRSTNGRLYFDVIGLDRVSRGWRLVSGLCRR